MDPRGKVVLITGGGRGIGAALAHAFAESGAHIAVVSRTAEEVEHVASETNGFAITADVRSEEDCTRVVAETIEHYGRIDILINNAGVAVNKPFTEHTEQEYDDIMETNVKGVFLMTKAMLHHHHTSQDDIGRAAAHPTHPQIIISISSGAGRMGMPGLSVYCASKFAVRGMMEALSQETHAKVYTVLPGPVDTQLYRELFDARARVKPEQIADAIVALVQQEPETGYELELHREL